MPTINIRYATDIASLKANLKEGVDQIEASRQAVDKLASSLRGDNLVAAANKYAAAVREIGGAANLTASQQERVNSIMTRAVESMNAAGKGGTALAQHFKELAEATATVEAPTNHVIGFLADLGRQIVGTAAGFLTAQAVLSGIQSVIRGVSSELETLTLHGAAVDDVTENFTRLTSQAGLLGSTLLGALRAGSHNTIDDFSLMKTVNQDLAAGLRLTDQQFGTLAKGAFALAKATGTDVKTALDTMNDAMLTGRTRSLALLTGKINLEAAEEKYAKSLGTTRDHLSDEGKLEAARAEILNSVSAATERLGAQTDGLGVRAEQAGVAWANFQDNLGKTIATSTVLETGLDGVKQVLIETFGGSQQSLIQAIAGAIENAEIAIVEFGKTGVEMGGDIVEEFYAVKKIFGDIEQVLDGVRLAALYTDRAMITLHADSHPGETTADAWKRVDDAIGQTLVTMKDRGKDLQDADAAQQNVGKTTAELAARLEGLRGRMAAAQQASADFVGPLQDVSAAQSAGAASADQHGAATKRSAKEISEAEAAAKKFAAAMKEVNSAVGGIGGVLDALPVGPVMLANGKLAGSISQVVLELKKANVGESTIAEALHLTEAQVKAVVTAEESRVKILQLETAASEQLGESLNKLGKVDIETIAHLKEQIALGDKIRSAERAGLPGTGESTNIGQIGNIVGSSKAVVDGIEKVGQAFKETDADIADAISEFGFIGPVFDRTAEQADKLGENLQHSVGETIANFPKLLQQGLTGGGGVSGAVSALGAELGADVGTSFSNKFKDAISRNLDAAFGQKVGDILAGAITGGIVPIVSSLIGSLINKIKNIGGPSKAEVAGRQGEAGAEQQYAALLTAQERVQAGTSAIAQGEAGLHKALTAAGMDDAKAWDYARQQFDKMLAAEKQGPAAVQAIKDATDAYVESLQKVHDFESQFGPSHSELVQAAKDAEAGFAAMQASGDYTADQLAKAFEKVKEAEAAAGDAAAQAWLDAKKATTDGVASMQADLDKLQTQRDDLAKGVAAEAPEAVMGSIEKATRDQIAALDQQIADQKTKMEQAAKNTADSLQTATDAAGSLGGALDQAAKTGSGAVDDLSQKIYTTLPPSTEPFQAHLDGLGSTLSDTLPADAQTAASGINDALASIARDITVNVHYNVPPLPGAPNGEAREAVPGAGGATGGLVADLVRGFQPRSFATGGPVGYSMPILPPVNPSDTQLIWTNPNEWIFDRPRQAVILSQLQASASMAEFVRDTVREITAAPSAPQPSLANITPRGGDVYLDSRKVGQVIWSPEALSGETRQLARLQVKQLGKEGA